MTSRRLGGTLAALGLLVFGCGLPQDSRVASQEQASARSSAIQATPQPGTATPIPFRPNYKPGELVDYAAQSGDTLPALAAHFNTTIGEILAANPLVPPDATTMPPGLPMKIPIYFRSLWGNPFHILSDSLFVNGPAQIGFNTAAFVSAHPGWLKSYSTYAAGRDRDGAEIVDLVSQRWSISPRILLALLDYKAGALSQPTPPAKKYILDWNFEQDPDPEYRSYAVASNLNYLQLTWAATTLNNGYYGWRTGNLTEFYEPDGTIIRPDPWQNAASVAFQYFFSRTATADAYDTSVSSKGFLATYEALFGPAPADTSPLMPGSLRQPELRMPFSGRQVWTYTGGPHTGGYGRGQPYAAVDFAPPCDHPGCASLSPLAYVIAMADGIIARSGPDGVVLDLDGDGDERTGWDIFYLHLAAGTRVVTGQELRAGDPMGYPSSEGGEATGTHIHIARKYNGEWIVADGPLAFDLDGWIVHAGQAPYLGTLTRNGATVVACSCSDLYSEVPVRLGR